MSSTPAGPPAKRSVWRKNTRGEIKKTSRIYRVNFENMHIPRTRHKKIILTYEEVFNTPAAVLRWFSKCTPNSYRGHIFAGCGISIPAAVWRGFAPQMYAGQLPEAKKCPILVASQLAVVDSAFVNVRRSRARARPRPKCTIFIERGEPPRADVEVPNCSASQNALFPRESCMF